jgi:hypothetical protein
MRTSPVCPEEQWGMQRYGIGPGGSANLREKRPPGRRPADHTPLAAQGGPLVVEWVACSPTFFQMT